MIRRVRTTHCGEKRCREGIVRSTGASTARPEIGTVAACVLHHVPGAHRMRAFPVLLSLLLATVGQATDRRSPGEIYGELFERIQLERVYPDGKNFVDALPVKAPEEVLADYRAQRGQAGFDLRKFVESHFRPPPAAGGEYHTVQGQDVREHIDAL